MERNDGILTNPLPNTIPGIVWDDLPDSEKIKIFDAIKLRYSITYRHAERRPKGERNLADTDVIEIREYDSENGRKASSYAVSRLYSRATSERRITTLDNPVPDIIPCDIWNNLPDVLKEEIVEGKNYCRKHEGDYRFNVSYSPDENTIVIEQGHFMGRHCTNKYDAKRGVYINGIVSYGL